MKKIVFFLVLLIATHFASGQRVRLNGYAAYVFDDGFDSYYDSYNYYDGKISGGFQWGVGVEYMIQPEYCIELMYINQSTTAPTRYQGGIGSAIKNETFDLGLNYILIGGEGHKASRTGKVEGYAGMFLGMCIINLDNPSNGNSASDTKFAWGARMGVNIWTQGKIGIKLQAQLLSISQGAGGGFYFGTGGAGVGLSSYSSIYQFGLGGGLTFKLGQ